MPPTVSGKQMPLPPAGNLALWSGLGMAQVDWASRPLCWLCLLMGSMYGCSQWVEVERGRGKAASGKQGASVNGPSSCPWQDLEALPHMAAVALAPSCFVPCV
uniref:Uncharacterized protein n=1 Tax=Rousettus aegyptiacus TaxID=9407 RepID=A0A7J8FDB4_ROUAE|nr:hypothetical protein HJG63_000070 [Rousettus aegyptiacus]